MRQWRRFVSLPSWGVVGEGGSSSCTVVGFMCFFSAASSRRLGALSVFLVFLANITDFL